MRSVKEDIAFGIIRWLLFVVALALLPVGISAFSTLTRGDALDFVGLFEHGELLLVSAAVVGAALADLVSEGRQGFRTVKLSVGGMAGIVVLGASVWFADIAAGRRDGSPLDQEGIAVGSVVVFALAVLTGLSCIVVAELARER